MKKFVIEMKNNTLGKIVAALIIFMIIFLLITIWGLRIVENSRKNDFKATVYELSASAENNCLNLLLNRQNGQREIEIINFQMEGDSFSYDGKIPEGGKLLINSACQVSLAVYDGAWCIKKTYDKNEVEVYSINHRDECLIDETLENSCDYNCAYLKERMDILMSALFDDDLLTTVIPEIDSNSDAYHRLNEIEEIEIISNETISDSPLISVKIAEKDIILFQTKYNGFPKIDNDIIDFGDEFLMVVFTVNGNEDQDFAWLFYIDDINLRCERIKITE